MKKIFSIALLAGLLLTFEAFAQNYPQVVIYETSDDVSATFTTVGADAKSKNVQDNAVKSLFYTLFYVGVDGVNKIFTEQCFRGRTDAVTLLQLFAAAVGDPGTFRCKTLHMVLFLLQQRFGQQHGHHHILCAGVLEHLVHDGLNVLPDGVAIGTIDEHTLDGRVVD